MPSYTSWSPNVSVAPPTDAHIGALAGTYRRWDVDTLTYSFPSAGALWANGYPASYAPDPPYTNFTALDAQAQANVRDAMSKWADLINMKIVEVPDSTTVGDLRLAYYGTQAGYQGFAHPPDSSPWAGDAWFSPGSISQAIRLGWPNSQKLILHEIGHALGLTHPYDGLTPLPAELDDARYTVMSQNSFYNFAPTTPMLLDIAAIQYLYGANYDTRPGNDAYVYNESRTYHETIWDGGGIDTIQYSGWRDAKIDLNSGHSSRIGLPVYSELVELHGQTYDNVWIAYGATIENAITGGGNDVLIGNAGNNLLSGGDGRDTVVCDFTHDACTVTRSGAAFALAGPEGDDTLVDVERVRFSDNYAIALDVQGNAGQAYRLYQAAFDRAPDLPGLGFQMNDLDMGYSLAHVAQNFIDSPEFQRTYGPSISNTEFITLLYRNVLNREPEAAGLQYHLDEFAAGDTRANMLTHFSESPENQANVIGQIEDGMLFIPYA
jgi:hypothetical protein